MIYCTINKDNDHDTSEISYIAVSSQISPEHKTVDRNLTTQTYNTEICLIYWKRYHRHENKYEVCHALISLSLYLLLLNAVCFVCKTESPISPASYVLRIV